MVNKWDFECMPERYIIYGIFGPVQSKNLIFVADIGVQAKRRRETATQRGQWDTNQRTEVLFRALEYKPQKFFHVNIWGYLGSRSCLFSLAWPHWWYPNKVPGNYTLKRYRLVAKRIYFFVYTEFMISNPKTLLGRLPFKYLKYLILWWWSVQ